jgi:hypothetical protein
MVEKASFLLLEHNDTRWMDFIKAHPDAHIFHHPDWISLLARCYGYRPFVAAVLNAQGQVTAGLPVLEINGLLNKRRWVSLPFTDYCPPLYSDDESFHFLEKSITEETQKQNIADLELRWDYQSPGLFRQSEFVLTTIKLYPSPDQVSKNIKSSDFHKITLAGKKGVHVESGISTQFLEAFYQLHVLTRRRHGVPVQPFNYFRMLRDEILESGKGFISLAYKDDVPIAGGLYLHWNKTLVYKYAASTELGRQLYANDPIVWGAICWGCAHGYTTFDWGRSDASNAGLRRFKNRWGSDETPLYYSRNHEPVSNGLEQKMTPIMNAVINKSPLWVCRFSGELLYRYIG